MVPYHNTANLRLEVEAAPAGLPNLFPDPDGELGTWVLAPFTQNTAGEPTLTSDGTKYTVTNSAATANTAATTTSFLPLPASNFVRIRYTVTAITAGHQLVIGAVYWWDADKVGISNVVPTFAVGTGAVGTNYSQLVLQAPANAAYMWLQFSLKKGAASADVGASASFNQVMITHAATSGALAGNFAMTDPITWANVLGPAHAIEIERETLDVGTLSAVITDATLDPAVSSTLAMGKAVRVQALVSGVWESLFVGKILDAEVTYSRGPVGQLRTRITLSAVDGIAQLANTPEDAIWCGVSGALATFARLPKILEWVVQLPWNINGSTARFRNSTGAVPTAYEPDGNTLSSLAITRDSCGGYAWMSRKNVTTAYTKANLPAATQCAFTDVATGAAGSDYYSAIDVGWSTKELINQISMDFLKRSGAVEPAPTTTVAYGPYEDAASRYKYGPKAHTYTITNGTESAVAIAALAATYIAANKTPLRQARSLKMPVRDARSLGHAANLDLYDKVSVTFSTVLAAVAHRVTSIKHNIDTDGWTVDYGFSFDGAQAIPR